MFSYPCQPCITSIKSVPEISIKAFKPSIRLLLPEPLLPMSTVSGVKRISPLSLTALKFFKRNEFRRRDFIRLVASDRCQLDTIFSVEDNNYLRRITKGFSFDYGVQIASLI